MFCSKCRYRYGHLHQVGESSIKYSFDEPLLYDSSPTNLAQSATCNKKPIVISHNPFRKALTYL